MSNNGKNTQLEQTLIMVFGLMLVVGTIGVGFLYFSGAISDSVQATQTTTITIEDITDLEDETEVIDKEDPPDDPPEIVVDPDPEPDPVIVIPDVPDPEPTVLDHSFSGKITVTAELLDEGGNPLSIALDFTKDATGAVGFDIDKLRIKYNWDFDLGEDIDPDSFKIYVTGNLKKIYWRDLLDPSRSGTINGQTIFQATGFQAKGWDTQTFDIEDSKLRFNDMDNVNTEKSVVYTTTNSFLIEWEAEISTKGGTAKKISGSTGVALNLYYLRTQNTSDYSNLDQLDPDVIDWFGSLGWEFDPYDQTPLLSMVSVG